MPGKKDNDQTLYDDRLDANGNKCVAITAKTVANAGEDVVNDVQKVETRGANINILTATTSVVKSGPGHLNSLFAVGGTMGNVTIYDNTAASGTVLWGPGTPAAGARIAENIEFAVGLTIVTAAASFLGNGDGTRS
jgi:hypothetical protein